MKHEEVQKELAPIRDMVRACIQCGTCTGSCPNAFAMDLTPRRLWRLVLAGEVDEVFDSHSFALCSACYYCTLRCPRGLPLTGAMAALKRAAAVIRPQETAGGRNFYRHFLAGVRRRGRVNEMEFMTWYFLSEMNPVLPFRFAGLGLKLMSRKKVDFFFPKKTGSGPLEPIFRKVSELEGRQ